MTVSMTEVAPERRDLRYTGLGLVLGAAVVFAVLVAGGWLVTGSAAHHWPLDAEDGVNRFFARHRTPALNSVSGFFSTLANTPSAIALSAVAVIAIRVLTHRWPEAVFVALALTAEVSIFLLTTLVIDRPRPAVPHLDLAPPTSSFPSGHTAAATVLYVAVAVVARRHGAPWPVWLMVAVPCAVACSRLYRGMHHPSDVIAGAVLGVLCVVLADRVFLTQRVRPLDRPSPVPTPRPAGSPAARRTRSRRTAR